MRPDTPRVSAAKEGGGTLVRRAGIVGAGTLTSRILGFMRDVVIAAIFPAAATDLFFLVFTIPNALRMLLGEGAVASAVVPVFVEIQTKEGEEPARVYFAKITGLLLVVLTGVSAIGVFAAPAIVSLYATGYADDAARFEETVLLTRIVFPYIFFMGLAALGMGGCSQYVNLDVSNVFFITGPSTSVPFIPGGIPNTGTLNGVLLYAQSGTFTPGFNFLGVTSSNGLRVQLGSL